jgi:Protein of unknown function (DUF4242)
MEVNMSLIIVETTAEQPLTPDLLNEAHERVSPCLEARNVTWRYSLLSSDRHRMICTFDAPDAESVRDAYRKGGVISSRTWAGMLINPDEIQPPPNAALLKVVELTYPPLSEAEWNEVNSQTLRWYAERGIEWIRSYLSLDRTRLVSELNAPDLESIHEAEGKLGISFDRVWSAAILSA